MISSDAVTLTIGLEDFFRDEVVGRNYTDPTSRSTYIKKSTVAEYRAEKDGDIAVEFCWVKHIGSSPECRKWYR